MDAARSHTARPTKATPNASEVVTVESALCSDLLKAGVLSMREIDKLIGELQQAYDYIKYKGERLQSQATRYAHLSRTTLTSVKAVSEGLNKWRENASPPPNQATGTNPG
jgi:hypothetical protein